MAVNKACLGPYRRVGVASLLSALWWIVFGALLGWLGHWALASFFRRAETRTIEKTVEKVIDNPAHLTRIKSLEQELQAVPALKSRIAEMERRGPMIIDNIIEKPVEKIVDRVVDNPAHLSRIRQLEADLAIIPQLRGRIAELEARPPKIVEKPVEKIVEKPVERVIDRVVDNPAHLARIRSLEAEVSAIAGLRQKIAELEGRPARVVEKPVDRLIDNPVHVARVRMLEKEVGQIPALRAKIAELESRPLRSLDKLADAVAPYDRPVERIIERLVADPRANEEQNRRLRDLERRFDSIEAALLGRAQGKGAAPKDAPDPSLPVSPLTIGEIDLAAARAEGFSMRGVDDFEVIAGLGENAAVVLKKAGATTFAHIAGMTPDEIAEVLRLNGVEEQAEIIASWPEQAELAARNRWRTLSALQRSSKPVDR